jgi:hypothetical protein
VGIDREASSALEWPSEVTAPSIEKTRPIDEAAAFHIVGMGGSAGGLEAFVQFFSHLPPDSGLAFVLVPHLEPTHKGMMPELLQRHTKMKIVEKENLGMAMVRDPASAKFDGMPRSAINTGLVDYVAPAEELPAKLVQYIYHTPQPFEDRDLPEAEPSTELQKAFVLLRAHTGNNFSCYKNNTICRRIAPEDQRGSLILLAMEDITELPSRESNSRSSHE